MDGSTADYYLLAVRGDRADEPGAQLSELHVWPGNTYGDAESHKWNEAKPIQGIEEIVGHTAADYAHGTNLYGTEYMENIKYYTVYLTMSDNFVNIDTYNMFPASTQLYVRYHGDTLTDMFTLDDRGAYQGDVTVALEPGEEVSWIFITGHTYDPSTGTESEAKDCTYVLKIVRENTGTIEDIWISDYDPADFDPSTDMGDHAHTNGHISGDNGLAADFEFNYMWKGTGNSRYDPSKYSNRPCVDAGKMVWSPESTSVDKGDPSYAVDPDTAIKNNPYEFDRNYYNYSVLVHTLDTELEISAKATTGAKIEIFDKDGTLLASSASVGITPNMGTLTSADGFDTLTKIVYLDAGLNGGDRFMVRVTYDDGRCGVYWITVYRDTKCADLKFQTRVIGTTSAAVKWDREAKVTLYKKSDTMGYKSVMEATGGVSGIAAITGMSMPATATYAERFDALVAAGHLTAVSTKYSNKITGEYEFLPSDIGGPGTYMWVASRPGFLDNVVDNIRIYNTYAKAQYNLRDNNLRAGDINHDGIVDQIDVDLFTQYSAAMEGVYNEMAKRLLVANTTIDATAWKHGQNSGDLFDITGLKVEYDNGVDKIDLMDPANREEYKVIFYFFYDNTGATYTDLTKLEKLFNDAYILTPDAAIQQFQVVPGGLVGELYVSFTYKGLTAVMRVDPMGIDTAITGYFNGKAPAASKPDIKPVEPAPKPVVPSKPEPAPVEPEVPDVQPDDPDAYTITEDTDLVDVSADSTSGEETVEITEVSYTDADTFSMSLADTEETTETTESESEDQLEEAQEPGTDESGEEADIGETDTIIEEDETTEDSTITEEVEITEDDDTTESDTTESDTTESDNTVDKDDTTEDSEGEFDQPSQSEEEPIEGKEPIIVDVIEVEPDQMVSQVVDAVVNSMTANNMTLGQMDATNAQQVLFAALAAYAAPGGPSYPTTLPAILDFDENNTLTVADLTYILRYRGMMTYKHCWKDNNVDKRRSMLEYWN